MPYSMKSSCVTENRKTLWVTNLEESLHLKVHIKNSKATARLPLSGELVFPSLSALPPHGLSTSMERPRTTIWMVLLIRVLVASGGGQDKVWRRSTSWHEAVNWLGGRPPCPGERALLNSVAVGLPRGSTVVREVILPKSGGQLNFPETAELVVTGVANDPQCPPKDVEFVRNNSFSWADPDNWRLPGADFSAAVPHTERIPCKGDRVIFPQDNTFFVRFPFFFTSVAAINIDGEDLTESEWRELLRSERGRSQLVSPWGLIGNPSVSMEVDDCEDALCRCHHSVAIVVQAVCAFASLRCPATPCVNPIQPPGHCCPLCGAFLSVGHGSLSSQPVLDVLEMTLPPGVEMHASLGDGGEIYVVMVDRGGYDGLSADAADVMAEALRTDSRLLVHTVSLITSGPAIKMSLVSSFFGGLMGTLAMVVVVLGMLYLLLYSRYSFPALKMEAPPFVRFENVAMEAREEEEEGAVVKVVTPPPQSFDNPMYGKPGPGTMQKARGVTNENPTYQMLQQRQEVEELEEVDIETSTS